MNPKLGAVYLGNNRCQFEVWAPWAESVEVHVVEPRDDVFPLEADSNGYHRGEAGGIIPGTKYLYRLNSQKERPDPASRFQPQGVHSPSEVVDPSFNWSDQDWRGPDLDDYLLYEIHVGTFTAEGTFDAAARRLDDLETLGVSVVELMPVGQFPGSRNWGYDGVYPFAVQASYGGPGGLKRFVNACHERGLGVALDVIYNHLGPEGNYLAEFAPYFTDRYRTPWGPAINFDGPWSDEVRRYFIENALQWVTEFHIDALRLDAIHAIVDPSAVPFLEDLGAAVHQEAARLGRNVYVIPESDRNDSRFVAPRASGGVGLDGQWSDDFHHAMHTLLTGERAGYYQDFGRMADLATAYREGFVYSGKYSAYRRQRHGNSSRHLEARQFIVFAQNHDQVGNRMLGDRLSQLISFDALKLAASTLLLAPFVPLLFMGEEYGEQAPFLYFMSHGDPGLIQAVRKGRREEFAAFRWQGEIPDPQDEATFLRSQLHWRLREERQHKVLLEFYRELICIRKSLPSHAHLSKQNLEVAVHEEQKILMVRRWFERDQTIQLMNFSSAQTEITLPIPPGKWTKLLDSCDSRWGGTGGSAPEEIVSRGETTWSLPSYACLLLAKSEKGTP
jgi:maltooligosyltrehalose trehalohydrolase